MAIRSILLHLDATPASISRLAFAHALADRHGARVTALFGARPHASQISYGYSAGAALRAVDEGAPPHAYERDRLRELLAERELECNWCEVAGDSVRHGFVAEAMYADLLVLGPPAGSDDEGAAPHGFVESVILDSGTPAIVVPYPHRQATVGERVLIAWNGSAAAARAMKAALPILQGAAKSTSRPGRNRRRWRRSAGSTRAPGCNATVSPRACTVVIRWRTLPARSPAAPAKRAPTSSSWVATATTACASRCSAA